MNDGVGDVDSYGGGDDGVDGGGDLVKTNPSLILTIQSGGFPLPPRLVVLMMVMVMVMVIATKERKLLVVIVMVMFTNVHSNLVFFSIFVLLIFRCWHSSMLPTTHAHHPW